jgi:hypothetical protein
LFFFLLYLGALSLELIYGGRSLRTGRRPLGAIFDLRGLASSAESAAATGRRLQAKSALQYRDGAFVYGFVCVFLTNLMH